MLILAFASIYSAEVTLLGPALPVYQHCPADLQHAHMCKVVTKPSLLLQVIYPDVQKRIIERARKRRLRLTVLKSLATTATPFGTLLLAEGGLNLDVADKLFDNFDKDNSNSIDAGTSPCRGKTCALLS